MNASSKVALAALMLCLGACGGSGSSGGSSDGPTAAAGGAPTTGATTGAVAGATGGPSGEAPDGPSDIDGGAPSAVTPVAGGVFGEGVEPVAGAALPDPGVTSAPREFAVSLRGVRARRTSDGAPIEVTVTGIRSGALRLDVGD